MNQTNIQVPRTANTKEKTALPHRVELGMNSSASRIPNCAEEMVAPVVGETNLFMQSCCIIRPATLIPIPVQRIAKRRGRREIRNTSKCSLSPCNSPESSTSRTPTNSDQIDSIKSRANKIMVVKCFFITDTSTRVSYS